MRALFHPFWLVNEEPVYHRSALVLLKDDFWNMKENDCNAGPKAEMNALLS